MDNKRNFTVKGKLDCLYEPGTTPSTKNLPGIEVELWAKSPLDVTLLGKSVTDEDGEYLIAFELDSPNPIIEDGKINEVFIKAYYQGVLITGDNPYA